MIDRKIAAQFAAVLLVFIALMMVLSSVANATTREPRFERHLPTAAPVYCTWGVPEWASELKKLGLVQETAAYTWMAGPRDGEIHLGPTTCAGLSDPRTYAFASAVETLYHEWFHSAFNTRDEGETECLSLFVLRYALREFWDFARKGAQIVYKRAWAIHAVTGMLFPAYKGSCRYQPVDPLGFL